MYTNYGGVVLNKNHRLTCRRVWLVPTARRSPWWRMTARQVAPTRVTQPPPKTSPVLCGVEPLHVWWAEGGRRDANELLWDGDGCAWCVRVHGRGPGGSSEPFLRKHQVGVILHSILLEGQTRPRRIHHAPPRVERGEEELGTIRSSHEAIMN